MITDLKQDPIERFRDAYCRAAKSEPFDHTAATLATANAGGRPSARVVLVKHFNEKGFVFFTNRESPKGRDLAENPRGALCFLWESIGQQIRIEGSVELASDKESDDYYASRPRGSQLGAWTSRQSEPMANRVELIRRYLGNKLRFAGRTVPRPPFWGGYRLVPERIEFWHRGTFRLHVRVCYVLENGKWTAQLLQP